MGRIDRLAARAEAMEADYRSLLAGALADCAAGRWGLFGQNGAAFDPPVLEALIGLADDIDAVRGRLGLEPFGLHRRFMAARGRSSENAPGEPRLAQAWLEALAAEA